MTSGIKDTEEYLSYLKIHKWLLFFKKQVNGADYVGQKRYR